MRIKTEQNISLMEWTRTTVEDGTTIVKVARRNNSTILIDCNYSYVKDMPKYKAYIALYWYCQVFENNLPSLEKLGKLENKDTSNLTSLEMAMHNREVERLEEIQAFQTEIAETMGYLCDVLSINSAITGSTREELRKIANEFRKDHVKSVDLGTKILVSAFWDTKGSKLPFIPNSGATTISLLNLQEALNNDKASEKSVKEAYLDAKKQLEELCKTLSIEETEWTNHCRLHANQTFTRGLANRCLSKATGKTSGNTKTGKLEIVSNFREVEQEMLYSCLKLKYLGGDK